MDPVLISPAHSTILFIPAAIIYLLIPLVGIGTFTFIIAKRSAPMVRSKPDFRWNNFFDRVIYTIQYWLMQYKQPRYRFAGVLHILLFAGFLILGIRSTSLVILGFYDGFVFGRFKL